MTELRIMRGREWSRPVRPARREVLSALPELEEGRPPLLFVDVAISATVSDRIPLWLDTDVNAAAAGFAVKHGLSEKMCLRLARMLATQRDALIAGAAVAR